VKPALVARARIEILTTDMGLLTPDETGLLDSIQAAKVVVTTDDRWRIHVVVSAAPWIRASDEARIRRLFPGELVSCVRAAAEGEATIACDFADEDDLRAAAAAVATIQRSWAWDESPAIRVRVVPADRTFTIDPVFSDGVWTAEHEPGGAG
jgi:hypothetical protein